MRLAKVGFVALGIVAVMAVSACRKRQNTSGVLEDQAGASTCESRMEAAVRALEAVNGGSSYAQGLTVDRVTYVKDVESRVTPGSMLGVYKVNSEYRGGTGVHEVAVTKDACKVEMVQAVYAE